MRDKSADNKSGKTIFSENMFCLGNVLYIANLSKRVNERDLEDKFERFGKIDNLIVVRDPISKESRGFAFITYERLDDAEEAIKVMHRTKLEGR